MFSKSHALAHDVKQDFQNLSAPSMNSGRPSRKSAKSSAPRNAKTTTILPDTDSIECAAHWPFLDKGGATRNAAFTAVDLRLRATLQPCYIIETIIARRPRDHIAPSPVAQNPAHIFARDASHRRKIILTDLVAVHD